MAGPYHGDVSNGAPASNRRANPRPPMVIEAIPRFGQYHFPPPRRIFAYPRRLHCWTRSLMSDVIEHWPPSRGVLLDLRGLLLPAAVATAEYVAAYAHLLERPGLLRIALVLALPSQAWLAEALRSLLPDDAPLRVFARFPDATQWLLGREYAGDA